MEKDMIVLMFFTALTDCFKEDEERELDVFGKLDLNEIDGNTLILSMFHAFQLVFSRLTSQNPDPLEFLSILTRLVFQEDVNHAMKGWEYAEPQEDR